MNTSPVKLLKTVPVIPVSAIGEATAFYRDRLGFIVVFQQGEYVGVIRDGVELHLDGVVNTGAGNVTCRIEAEGVDELYAEFDPRGVIDPAEPLRTTPWGSRQFSVLDQDGNRITFVHSP